MIVLNILAVLVGAVLVGAVLISALETVVLPRNGFTRITRFVFAVADRVLIHRWRNKEREANLRALYAPIALISLPAGLDDLGHHRVHLPVLGDQDRHRTARLRSQRILPVHAWASPSPPVRHGYG